MAKGLENLSAGKATYNWITSIAAKQPAWFLGSLQARDNYGAWIAHLAAGLRSSDFLMKFTQTSDPWQRSRLVGEKIAELRRSFQQLTAEQKSELGKMADTELRAGIALLGKDKQTIMQLIQITDPPTVE